MYQITLFSFKRKRGIMSTFTVVIKTDNQAYEDGNLDGNFYAEIVCNLKSVILGVEKKNQKGIIRDSNGNKVGKFYYESGE